MATSSIYTNVVINDPAKAEQFINALEQSSRDQERQSTTPVKSLLTDADEIRKLMARRNAVS